MWLGHSFSNPLIQLNWFVRIVVIIEEIAMQENSKLLHYISCQIWIFNTVKKLPRKGLNCPGRLYHWLIDEEALSWLFQHPLTWNITSLAISIDSKTLLSNIDNLSLSINFFNHYYVPWSWNRKYIK